MSGGTRKGLAVLSWLLVVVVLSVAAYRWVSSPVTQTHTTPFTVSSGYILSVNETVNAQFASESWFLLRQGDDVVSGKKTPPPLGWSSEDYYTTESPLSQGSWVVEEGTTITVKLANSIPVTITLTEGKKFLAAVLVGALGIVAFLFGLVLMVAGQSD